MVDTTLSISGFQFDNRFSFGNFNRTLYESGTYSFDEFNLVGGLSLDYKERCNDRYSGNEGNFSIEFNRDLIKVNISFIGVFYNCMNNAGLESRSKPVELNIEFPLRR